MTEAVFIQVGRGRVSLSSKSCSEFYFVETTFILEEIFLLLFRQPCVQFSLQTTFPQNIRTCNIGGLSGRGIHLFADYRNQERTVQEEGVTPKVRRTVQREYIVFLL